MPDTFEELFQDLFGSSTASELPLIAALGIDQRWRILGQHELASLLPGCSTLGPGMVPALEGTGVKFLRDDGVWATPGTLSLVQSFAGRTGAVVALAGDYTVQMITGAAPLDSPAFTGVPQVPTAQTQEATLQVANLAWVLSLASSSNPLIAGTATPGTSVQYARADHQHPVDTSRAAAVHAHTASQISDATSYGRQLLACASREAAVSAGLIYSRAALAVAGVTTFNGRDGDVMPRTGDYTVAMVTGAAPTVHTHTASQISDSTTYGRSLLLSTSLAAAQTAGLLPINSIDFTGWASRQGNGLVVVGSVPPTGDAVGAVLIGGGIAKADQFVARASATIPTLSVTTAATLQGLAVTTSATIPTLNVTTSLTITGTLSYTGDLPITGALSSTSLTVTGLTTLAGTQPLSPAASQVLIGGGWVYCDHLVASTDITLTSGNLTLSAGNLLAYGGTLMVGAYGATQIGTDASIAGQLTVGSDSWVGGYSGVNQGLWIFGTDPSFYGGTATFVGTTHTALEYGSIAMGGGSYYGAGSITLGSNLTVAGNGYFGTGGAVTISGGTITCGAITCTVQANFTGTFQTTGRFGVWSNLGPSAQPVGFGTPTGAARLSSFPGASATLTQTSGALADLLAVLKSYGFLGT